jgi:glycosyltransferase involved in cell wall biosynthesis
VRIGIDARAAGEVPAGHGRYARELLRSLASLDVDHRFVLYARRRWPCEELDERFEWRLGKGPFPVWQLAAGRDANRSCDVYLATAGYLVAAALRIPFAVVVHDLVAFDPSFGAPRGSLPARATLALAARRSDAMLAVSESTRRDLVARYPGAAGKTSVVYEAADPAFGEPRADCADLLRRLGVETPYVLATGTLEPRKNLPRLIEAFAGLPDNVVGARRLLLAGAKGWAARDTETWVSRHAGRVQALGYVSDPDLACLYQQADVFCYPSLYEGFGLPVLEAMAAGVAVITSNVSSLPEVGGDAAAYVDPMDVASIRDQLELLLSDSSARAELARRGPRQAARFSWRRTAEETLATLMAIGPARA